MNNINLITHEETKAIQEARQAAAAEAEQKILAAQRAAEADAAAAENAERIAFERLEAKQAAAAQAEAQRVANEQHRIEIRNQTIARLCTCLDMPYNDAKNLVMAIIDGKIANLFIKF